MLTTRREIKAQHPPATFGVNYFLSDKAQNTQTRPEQTSPPFSWLPEGRPI